MITTSLIIAELRGLQCNKPPMMQATTSSLNPHHLLTKKQLRLHPNVWLGSIKRILYPLTILSCHAAQTWSRSTLFLNDMTVGAGRLVSYPGVNTTPPDTNCGQTRPAKGLEIFGDGMQLHSSPSPSSQKTLIDTSQTLTAATTLSFKLIPISKGFSHDGYCDAALGNERTDLYEGHHWIFFFR